MTHFMSANFSMTRTFEIPVSDTDTGNVYIMMEARLEALYKSDKEYTIVER